jgi:hypothetical protein
MMNGAFLSDAAVVVYLDDFNSFLFGARVDEA